MILNTVRKLALRDGVPYAIHLLYPAPEMQTSTVWAREVDWEGRKWTTFAIEDSPPNSLKEGKDNLTWEICKKKQSQIAQ